MQFKSSVIALVSVMATSALGADVYSEFLDSNGNQIGTTNYDVGDGGCFGVTGAVSITFTQSGGTHTANGPYCLTGFANTGCGGNAASQQFANVELNDNHSYGLNSGLSNVQSYRWSAKGC